MDTVSFVVGIVGLIIGVLSLFKFSVDWRRKTNWRELRRAIYKLDHQCHYSRFDVIIGLADGLVPASIIALNWRIPQVYFIDAPTGARKGKEDLPGVNVSHIPDLTEKSVLLLDNHIYTGTNMRTAAEALGRKGAIRLTTAALFRHTGATAVYAPDHWTHSVNGRVRGIPWSYTREHVNAYLS